MTYDQFLHTVKVIRMLYGIREAQKFFQFNIAQFQEYEYDGITTIGNTKKEMS